MSEVANPTDLASALAFYKAYGLPVTPVRPGQKAGRLEGWSTPGHSATPADFRAGDNIGVLNGAEPTAGLFLHDADLDVKTPEARQIFERLLPATGWRYGRAGNPRSHASYLVTAQLRTRKYGGLHGNIIELRGITSKHTHSLSVGPGSTHATGERIRFEEPLGPIGRVENPDDLEGGVQHVAVAIIIMQDWPAAGRHNLRLAFAKILTEYNIPPARVIQILEAVMEATGSDVGDVAPAVQSTLEAIRAGQPTAGASTVIEALGEELGKKVLIAIAKVLRIAVLDEAVGVVMRGGDLTAIVDRAEQALLSTNIYQRGGILTRAIKLDRALGDGPKDVHREMGSTMLITVKEPWLIEQMGKTLKWFSSSNGNGPVPADPKPLYARTLLNRSEWHFPVLRGVITAPTLARDGRIIEAPGFDKESGLLVDITAGYFPPVPVNPTKDQAVAALARLAHPLRGFPFVSDASKSVALSALLTALVRMSLRTSPLHGFDAPTAGTGKSLLAEMTGLLASGFRPPAISQGKSDEEDEKRLSTILFAGDPVIHIDNCERAISGDFLCSMLTQEVVQARILGFSERRILPCTALVLASGNNLTWAGDTSRRAVKCRADAEVERPDSRTFDFDCHEEVKALRAGLVVDALTVLRAYVVAGRPEKLTPMGSFNDWEWIRGALVWLGHADPADTREAIFETDPAKDDLVAVMDVWKKTLGSDPTLVSEIGNHGCTAGRDVEDLRTKLMEVARLKEWSSERVGAWLRGKKDRVLGGRCFRVVGKKDGSQLWQLVEPQGRLPGADA